MKNKYQMPQTYSARVYVSLLAFLFCLVGLANRATAQSSVSFSISALSGETLSNPTSLQFGPDNRLYVAQQNGVINAYTIKKNAPNSYSVTATESIQLIKNIPNHDDNGVLNTSVITRQITGILVTGTAAVPVIYVSSSDPRIGGGGTAGDKNLDTNSGIISKLTKNSTGWVKVDVVKGLPRSEENHSTNGLVLDAATNTLYVASGGHTNAGSPSNNFAFLTEYALSAAILKINLSTITSQFGGSYTLPTLDDPSRANSGGADANDPWGGNDGLNQAKLVAGGPVQIHSAGYRNAYDLVITKAAGKAGRMYTIDNGANAGWGGYPDKEGTSGVTNKYVTGEPGSTTAGVNDAKVNNLDNLHLVSAPGMTPIYGGHPNPIRANPSGAGIYTFNNTTAVGTFSLTPTSDWPPVPTSMANPVEADYRNPGVNDGALYTWSASTNGIAEYTSQGFNGAMLGDLLAASFDGNIYRIKLNTAGTAISNVSILAGGFGSQPLDVTAQADNAIFPGTIWAATYGANSITILEPAGSSTCTGDNGNFNLDDDNDGYSNGDETANGTDPCSAASKPDDFDGDLISNLRDSDDDGDGLSDIVDKFAWDKLNGTTTDIPLDYPFLNGNPGFGFFGLGFTGLMTNNTTNYQNNFDPNKPNLVMGGAVGIATAPAEAGDPTTNNQKYAFQFGINVKQTTPAFTIRGKLLGSSFFDGATGTQLGTQSQGIYFGTGDQDNYMKIVLHANNGNPGLQILMENGGVVSYQNIFPVANILAASAVDVLFDINPANGTVQCKYQTNSASSPVNIGPAFTLTGNMLTAVQNNNALAVGLIASAGNKTAFTASWDYIKIISSVSQSLSEVIRINAGGPAIQFGSELWKADQYFTGGSVFSKTVAISNTTNDALYQTERYGNMTYNIPVPQSGQYTVELHFAEINFSTAGSRVFNLNVENGEFALQNIDLYKDYGGSNVASVIKTSNVQVNDGNLTIVLTNVVNNAKISGIAVFLQSSSAPTNQPPVVTKPANITLSSGQSWSYQVQASDPDAGAILTYSATNLPASLSINSNTGLITGNVSAPAGTYTVNLTVKDQQNLTANTSFVVTIGAAQPLTEVVRINAGGPAIQFGTQQWKADQYFTGGTAFSKTNAISNTTNDALYQTERYGNMTYNIPVPQAGEYTVELHFAEINFSTAGARVFNVNVESGEFSLQNIDLYKDYGGSNAASVITASNVQVSDGLLTITFSNVVNNAKISGIAVFLQSSGPVNRPPVVTKPADITLSSGQSWSYQVQASDPDAGAVLTYSATNLPASLSINSSTGLITGAISAAAGSYTVNLTVKDQQNLTSSTSFVITIGAAQPLTEVVRINAGGPNLQFGTQVWTADQYFTGGTAFSKTNAISNTTNDALYQTERYGNMTYNIPVPQAGEYTVELHFAEINFTTAGARVFNVNVESGEFSLQNIDLYKDYGGSNAASVITASNVQVSDGLLTITFTNVVNNAKISGIAVFRQTAGTSNQAPTANAGPDKTITLPTNSVVLNGSGSDPEDGTAVTFSWAQVSGPSTAGFSSKTVASPTVTNLMAGTYMFSLTVKDKQALSSSADLVGVTVNASQGTQQLVSFTLVNASNEQDIQVIGANAVLNLATLPSQSLNIRANTNPAIVGRVVLALSGRQTVNRTETGSPYTLFGDSNGNYASWTPAVGNYTLTGTPYTTSSGGTAGTPLTITFSVINQANQPPVVSKPPNATVVSGQSFTYQVIASDPENTALNYSATNLPGGLTINSSTGLISGTVNAAAAAFTVGISVKDAQNLTTSTSFILTVTNPNKPPVITTPPNASVISGQSFSYQVLASDPEGTALNYSASNLPAGLSINSASGLISGTVSAAAGSYTVVLTVKDQPGLTASTSFSIAVSNPNKPPVVTQPPNATVVQGQAFSYQVIASDPEGTALTFSATNLPAGLAINSATGLISGTVSGSAATYNVTLAVRDQPGLVATSGFSIIVNTAVTQQLVSFTLVNAANEQDIQTITDKSVLNLASLPSQSLNIRANTSPSIVGRVVLAMTGAQTVNRTETGSPYALFGDSNGNYASWTPVLGTYTLKGTPYTSSTGGTAGTPLTITFSVINQPNQPPVVTKPPNASVVTGQPFNYQVIASDPEGSALTYSASNLPGGLAINSSTGLISGTVSAAAATFTVSIAVRDLQNLTSTTSFVLAVTNPNLAPVITTPPDASVISGQIFSYQVVANDPEGTPLTYSATNLPSGLSINSTSGLISGMVNASAGAKTVILTVRDQPGLTASTSFIITVSNPNQPPVVTQPPNATVTQGQQFNYQVMANDPEGTTLTYSASNLPAALSINSASGLISGTVNDVAGDYNVALAVQDVQGLTVNKSFVLKVLNANRAPVITQPEDQTALQNAAFTYQVIASDPEDGLQGLLFAATGLPGGLSINASSGLISGTVTGSTGDYSVLLGIADKEGLAGEGKSFTISVSNANQPPEIVQPADQIAVKNEMFSYQVQAGDPEDGTVGLVYSASGLPAGLSINSSTGLISGIVTAVEDNYSVTLNVSDKDNLAAVSKTFEIRVTIPNQPPVITDTDDVIATRNQSFSYQIVASDPEDGQNALVYSASGLPAGLTLSSSTGIISGAVTAAAGDYPVTLDAQDKEGLSATDVIIMIKVLNDNQPPSITNPGNQTAVAGDPFSLQISASDPEQDNITFSATGLPEGLTINTAGIVSGTPENSSGNYTVVTTASDSKGAEAQTTFSITVNNRPVITSAPTNITLYAGEMLTFQVVATDADAGSSLSYSLSEPSAGFSINSNGIISGSTTELGTHTVVLTVTDEDGLASTTDLVITVVEQPAATMSTDSLPLNESLRISDRSINKDLLTVFPNPADIEFSLNFHVAERSDWRFTIFGINGNQFELPKHTLEKGVASVRFDLTQFSLKPGVYNLVITSNLGDRKSAKLIINSNR